MITHSTRNTGIELLEIKNSAASATISVYGGHVLSYIPAGEKDALFVSEKSFFEPGKAIRGGIPVCWPWFGPHPSDASLPLHGFIRTLQWQVAKTSEASDSSTVILECKSDAATKKLWSHDFRVTLSIMVGAKLELILTTHNEGKESFTVTDAFHTYFRVGDISSVSVCGLDGTSYDDKVGEPQIRTQTGDVIITGETNRIYHSERVCVVTDRSLERTTTIEKSGFPETVIWNPWVERAKAMADFDDEEYHTMVCAEAASVGVDSFIVKPGSSVAQNMTITVKTNKN